MAVFDKFSSSCDKNLKQKPVLSQGFVNYLQSDLHIYLELMNLKMRKYNYSFVSRTHWPKDAKKFEDARMLGCKDTNKHTWTWGYEDKRMQGYKEAQMNLGIWRCKDASIQANTYKTENMRMWGYKDTSKHTWTSGHEDAGMQAGHKKLKIWGCKYAWIQTSTQKHKDTRVRECGDTSMCTGI